jgi:hypothetical protein
MAKSPLELAICFNQFESSCLLIEDSIQKEVHQLFNDFHGVAQIMLDFPFHQAVPLTLEQLQRLKRLISPVCSHTPHCNI